MLVCRSVSLQDDEGDVVVPAFAVEEAIHLADETVNDGLRALNS
jgi:hypothetical protein